MNDISRVCKVPANDPPSENDLKKYGPQTATFST